MVYSNRLILYPFKIIKKKKKSLMSRQQVGLTFQKLKPNIEPKLYELLHVGLGIHLSKQVLIIYGLFWFRSVDLWVD